MFRINSLAIKFCTVAGLLWAAVSFAQVNAKKVDSLAKSIELSSKKSQQWQDSFTKAQDSIYQSSQVRSDHAFKKQDENLRQTVIVRIIISVLVASS